MTQYRYSKHSSPKLNRENGESNYLQRVDRESDAYKKHQATLREIEAREAKEKREKRKIENGEHSQVALCIVLCGLGIHLMKQGSFWGLVSLAVGISIGVSINRQ